MIKLNENDKQFVNEMWEKLSVKLLKSAKELRDIIPYTTVDGKYIQKEVDWWTNGFFGGLMWLMYAETGNDEFKITAECQEKLLDGALEEYDKLHHDVGFMWGLTSKAGYLLTGNKKSRIKAMYMANVLAGRANIKAGFIRAWNWEPQYSIIDCMMNIPLLYWASREAGDDRFKYIAQMHADMTLRDHIREDGSVVHIAVHDEESEKIVETLAGQGYAVGSAWTRGQAWAVYGFILSYIHTGEKKYLEAGRKVADYFLENAEKENYKVVCDFAAPAEPKYFDNTAAVCACCGIIELYKATGEEKYLNGAISLLRAIEEDCIFDDSDQSILQMGREAYSSEKHIPIIYGDFFLCEALLKLKGSEFLIW